MKLTKRESVLLILMAVILAAAALWMLVLRPAVEGFSAKRLELSDLELYEMNMKNSIAFAQTAKDSLEEQRERAAENYDSFYSTLNSYTIDGIVSSLLQQNLLDVESLYISPYVSVSEAELFGEVSEEEGGGGYLMKSTVNLKAGGAYEDVLSFIDQMNDRSFCLRVSNMDISFSTDQTRYPYEARMTCTIDIYGIEQPMGLDPA